MITGYQKELAVAVLTAYAKGDNVTDVFRKIARKHDRKSKSVESLWYNNLSKKLVTQVQQVKAGKIKDIEAIFKDDKLNLALTAKRIWLPIHDQTIIMSVFSHLIAKEPLVKAFAEAHIAMPERTEAAIAKRWTTDLRPKYLAQYKLAKAGKQVMLSFNDNTTVYTELETPKQQEQPQQMEIQDVQVSPAANSLSQLGQYIEKFTQEFAEIKSKLEHTQELNVQLVEENNQLKELNKDLAQSKDDCAVWEKKFATLQKEFDVVNGDYRALMAIMDRARLLAVREEECESFAGSYVSNTPKFKMDANGNLERINK